MQRKTTENESGRDFAINSASASHHFLLRPLNRLRLLQFAAVSSIWIAGKVMAHQKRLVLFLCLLVICGCGTDVEKPTANNLTPRMAIPASQVGGSSAAAESNQKQITLAAGQVARTQFEATIIDTTKFDRAVWRTRPYDGPVRDVESIRGGEQDPPPIRIGQPNDLAVNGGVAEYSRLEPVSRFPGITQSLFTPPDPTLAVGPSHIVEMVNTEIAFITKTGEIEFQAILGDQGDPGFFEEVGAGGFCVDPRCVYDQFAERFVVLCLEVYFDPPESFLTMAVSDDDDPNGIWFKYRTDAAYDVDNTLNFPDYPSLGYDANGYYISGNLFGIDDFDFRGVSFRTIDKTPLLTGDPIVVNDTIVDDFSINSVQMAQYFGDQSRPLAVSFNNNSSLTLIALDDPFGSLNVLTQSVPIPTFDGANGAENNGGFISTVGSRAMNAHVRGDKFFTCNTVSISGQDLARWYEFNLNGWPGSTPPNLIQSGDINLGNGIETFFPAIYSNDAGSVALVYGRSSSNEFISVNASGRYVDDPLGTMSEMAQFEVSSSVANGRFGDYFDIAIDPTNDSTFWIVGETEESFGWNTVVNSFVIPLIGDVNCDGSLDLLDVAPFIDALNGGVFVEKADINQDGVLNLLDVSPFIELLSN